MVCTYLCIWRCAGEGGLAMSENQVKCAIFRITLISEKEVLSECPVSLRMILNI